MVIINFSYNNQDFLKTIKDLIGKYDVLDVTGVLPKGSTIINVKALDPQLIILRNTVKDMIDAIGDVSLVGINKTTQIRDIEWNGLNLFWQTSISEKYPTRSFLTDLFYLKNIIKKGLVSLAKKKILVILPSVYSAVYCTSIRNYLIQKCLAAEVDFNYQLKKHYFAGPRTFFKKIRMGLDQSMKFRKKLKDIRTNTKGSQFNNYVVTTCPGTWEENNQEDRILGKIHNYRFGSSSTYLPYFNDLETNINWSGKWDHTYIRSFPTILQLCNHSLKAFLVYRKIRSLRDIDFKNIDFIDGNVLAYEFQKVVFDQNYVFVNYLWMRNHFSLCKHKTNIFFQDEFYPTGGRFISQAINRTNNKNMTSYGVQHGIIYEGHTVYNMTPVELECNKPFNGLPKPHKFILWGDFFKEVLNKNKAFADDELVVAGNLNYIVTAEKYKKLNNKNSVPGILWCTANDYLIKDQFDILKPLLASLTDYQLVIRFHPMLNIKDKLIEVIDKDIMNKVVFKNDNDIFDAIFKADIILAITASSIFMDALVLNKMVFQFKIDGHILSDFPNKNTLVIDSEEKLIQAYNDLLEGKYAKDQLSSQKLLHMSDGKWREILSV